MNLRSPWRDLIVAPLVHAPIILPPEEFSFAGIRFTVAPDSRLAVPTWLDDTPEPWPWFDMIQTFTIPYPTPVFGPFHRFADGDLERRVSEEHVGTLLDLARANNEPMFMELAACVGVAKGDLLSLWNGTRKRLGFPEPKATAP